MTYLGRATVFEGHVKLQGFGTEAAQYSGELVEVQGVEGMGSAKVLQLTYGGGMGDRRVEEIVVSQTA